MRSQLQKIKYLERCSRESHHIGDSGHVTAGNISCWFLASGASSSAPGHSQRKSVGQGYFKVYFSSCQPTNINAPYLTALKVNPFVAKELCLIQLFSF
jgi:hypothetical protein